MFLSLNDGIYILLETTMKLLSSTSEKENKLVFYTLLSINCVTQNETKQKKIEDKNLVQKKKIKLLKWF